MPTNDTTRAERCSKVQAFNILDRNVQIFRKSKSHLKLLVASGLTCSKFIPTDPKILGVAIWRPGFVRLWITD